MVRGVKHIILSYHHTIDHCDSPQPPCSCWQCPQLGSAYSLALPTAWQCQAFAGAHAACPPVPVSPSPARSRISLPTRWTAAIPRSTNENKVQSIHQMNLSPSMNFYTYSEKSGLVQQKLKLDVRMKCTIGKHVPVITGLAEGD